MMNVGLFTHGVWCRAAADQWTAQANQPQGLSSRTCRDSPGTQGPKVIQAARHTGTTKSRTGCACTCFPSGEAWMKIGAGPF